MNESQIKYGVSEVYLVSVHFQREALRRSSFKACFGGSRGFAMISIDDRGVFSFSFSFSFLSFSLFLFRFSSSKSKIREMIWATGSEWWFGCVYLGYSSRHFTSESRSFLSIQTTSSFCYLTLVFTQTVLYRCLQLVMFHKASLSYSSQLLRLIWISNRDTTTEHILDSFSPKP